MSKLTFEQRCLIAEQCLPDAPYRDMLKKLHTEMLEALAEQPAQHEPVDIEHCLWARNGNTPCPHTSTPAQRKPLTDEQLKEVIGDWSCLSWKDRIGEVQRIARAIEAAHGIKENT